jgi:hypothetical protein
MVKQGIMLGHVMSERGIEVDKAKVELKLGTKEPTTEEAKVEMKWTRLR